MTSSVEILDGRCPPVLFRRHPFRRPASVCWSCILPAAVCWASIRHGSRRPASAGLSIASVRSVQSLGFVASVLWACCQRSCLLGLVFQRSLAGLGTGSLSPELVPALSRTLGFGCQRSLVHWALCWRLRSRLVTSALSLDFFLSSSLLRTKLLSLALVQSFSSYFFLALALVDG